LITSTEYNIWNACIKTGVVVYARNFKQAFMGDLYYLKDKQKFVLAGIPYDDIMGQPLTLSHVKLSDVEVFADFDRDTLVIKDQYIAFCIYDLEITKVLEIFLIKYSNYPVYKHQLKLVNELKTSF